MDEIQLQAWPARSRHWQTMRISLFRVDLSGSLGLGDAIKDVTSAVGIPPCSGCERRAAVLNRFLRLPRFKKTNRSD
ncbi:MULTISPECIES: hypothetical protein [unclassified Arthrobacter]|uniref:hypothetical protein n=1 Tax=unclassified Arthrobacter TaxID=235627 RepID=UPI00209851A7|nr:MULTISPECIES: hypothetical protein [unclassified Arthrobacter]MDD1475961.1 hypothetical protein [Arthrobacter sp. H16F315]